VFDAKAKSASLSTSLFRPNLNAVGELEGLHWGGMMLLPSELPRRAPTSATAAVPKYPPFAEGLAHGLNRPKAEVSARYAIGGLSDPKQTFAGRTRSTLLHRSRNSHLRLLSGLLRNSSEGMLERPFVAAFNSEALLW
jgi:hypothetical protein